MSKISKSILSSKVSNGYIQSNKKQIHQQVFFRYGMTHLSWLSKKLGKTLKLQKDVSQTKLKGKEMFADTWRDKKGKVGLSKRRCFVYWFFICQI